MGRSGGGSSRESRGPGSACRTSRRGELTRHDATPAGDPPRSGDDLHRPDVWPLLPDPPQPVPVGAQAGRTQGARTARSPQERGVDVSSDSSEPPTGSPPTGSRANHAPEPPIWRPRPGQGRVGAPVPHGTAATPSFGGGPGAVTRSPWQALTIQTRETLGIDLGVRRAGGGVPSSRKPLFGRARRREPPRARGCDHDSPTP
jgi:hypothetical protein